VGKTGQSIAGKDLSRRQAVTGLQLETCAQKHLLQRKYHHNGVQFSAFYQFVDNAIRKPEPVGTNFAPCSSAPATQFRHRGGV